MSASHFESRFYFSRNSLAEILGSTTGKYSFAKHPKSRYTWEGMLLFLKTWVEIYSQFFPAHPDHHNYRIIIEILFVRPLLNFPTTHLCPSYPHIHTSTQHQNIMYNNPSFSQMLEIISTKGISSMESLIPSPLKIIAHQIPGHPKGWVQYLM